MDAMDSCAVRAQAWSRTGYAWRDSVQPAWAEVSRSRATSSAGREFRRSEMARGRSAP